MIQKKILRGVFILALVLFPQILLAQEKGTIQPMIYGEFGKMQLLPSKIWLMEERPISDIERELLQVSYLRGLYDGFQLSNVGWASIHSVLNDLAGMNLAQLRDGINKLYREYTEMGNNPPAIMVLEIIPEIRKRVPPADPGQEKTK
jgi:archaellum biogenesis protein FlaJ (TadC family)